MSEDTNELRDGNNLAPLKAEMKKDYAYIIKRRKDRQAINDDINAVRSKMESKGVPKKAFDFGLKYLLMDQEERDAYDNAMIVVREVIGQETEDLVTMMQKDKKKSDDKK